ncbi:MAG: hypothetical protein HKP61_17645 [Dactylosporangium sp.]|nr:hypothetical protein [Dactylosporangium sp.]
MAGGGTSPIKDVEVGDEVVATDPQAGLTEAKPVTQLHVNVDSELTDVTVYNARTRASSVVKTTAHHPFWDATADTWVDAAKLAVGHRLLVAHDAQRLEGDNSGAGSGGGGPPADGASASGASASDEVIVLAVDNHTGTQIMRDLTVADTHTYYVIAGTVPVLVHNCGPNDIDPWQVMDRIDEHVIPLHGPGTESAGSKFLPGTTREDIANTVHEGLGRSASGATGNHPHVVDLGRDVGTVTAQGGVTKPTSRVKIWMTDGRLGTIHPTLERP